MKTFGLSAAAAVLLVSSQLHAAPLLPGGVIFPTGTTSVDPVHGGALATVSDNVLSFEIDPTPAIPVNNINGFVQNRVMSNASGELIFAPRIFDPVNLEGGVFAIDSFRLEGFGMFDTDVDYRTDLAGDKGPTTVSRSIAGDLLTFRYADPLYVDAIQPGPRHDSLFPSIATNATAFDNSGAMTLFGTWYTEADGIDDLGDVEIMLSVRIEGLAAPIVAPIPLPASALLLGAALLGLGVARRRT